MAQSCNDCKTQNHGDGKIIFTEYGYEAHEARHEREKKRLWIVCLVLIAALIITNFAWIIYECSFEDVVTTEEYEIDQNAESGDNNSIINGGEIINGEPKD